MSRLLRIKREADRVREIDREIEREGEREREREREREKEREKESGGRGERKIKAIIE